MESCCDASKSVTSDVICPLSKTKGKQVKLITLESLLNANALAQLESDKTYYFCSEQECNVVYFNEEQQVFIKNDLKVPVFQKDLKEDVLACYCFNWTRARIREEIKQTGKSEAVHEISMHIKANRCGCEVNNPQGSCCLGNVSSFIKQVEKLY
ncbi:(2Fe-2S)-binding protein [Bacillus cereus]